MHFIRIAFSCGGSEARSGVYDGGTAKGYAWNAKGYGKVDWLEASKKKDFFFHFPKTSIFGRIGRNEKKYFFFPYELFFAGFKPSHL